MANKSEFSKHGLPFGAAVDVGALSDRANRKILTFPVMVGALQADTAYFTQNETNKFSLGPLGFVGTLREAYISVLRLPAGGTLSARVVAYDASGDTEINLTDTLNPEALTIREATAFDIATTNVELQPEDTIEVHLVADNNAVGTDAQSVSVTLAFEPTEATIPTR